MTRKLPDVPDFVKVCREIHASGAIGYAISPITPAMRCIIDVLHAQMKVAAGALRKLNHYERTAVSMVGANEGWIDAQIYVQHGGEEYDRRRERT